MNEATTEDIYEFPMSYAQQRMWFLDQLEPESSVYNIPASVRLLGKIDVDALEKSMNAVTERHESLRTVFGVVEGEPRQLIHSWLDIPLRVMDLGYLPEDERLAEAMKIANEEALLPFDLARGPLLRVMLAKLAEEDHVLMITMHHIISDGWSMSVFIREMMSLYYSFHKNEPAQLDDLPIQYADFSIWQRDWLSGETLENQLGYWKRQLAGAPPVLDLPLDNSRPPVKSSKGAFERFTLDKETLEKLKTFGAHSGASLYMSLLAAFSALLSRYNGKEDIVTGSLIANRNREELEPLIGFFVNTLVMRMDVSGDPTFAELLDRAKKVTLEAYTHQDVPFEQLVEAMNPERTLSHTPLIQALLTLQNAPVQKIELPGLAVLPFDKPESVSVRFDMELYLWETDTGLNCDIVYNTELFSSDTVKRLGVHFRTILESAAADPETRISRLPMLTEEEKRKLIYDWNNTAADYPKTVCAHNLFTEQAAKTPDDIAIQCGGEKITYAALNKKADALAARFRDKGVAANGLVGIMMERSPEAVVAILGIMKAGGAYVPVDPKYPADRISHIMKDSGMRLLLTGKSLFEKTGAASLFDGEVIYFEDGFGEDVPAGFAESVNSHRDLAYVIYTSGSTGLPKGTLIEHGGLMNYLWWGKKQYLNGESLDFPLFSSLSFDLTVTSIFLPLIGGGRVVIYKEDTGQTDLSIARVIEDNAVDIIKLTPSHLAIMADMNLENPRVKKLILGGEELKTDLALRIHEKFRGNIEILNEYGPTETVVGCMIHKFDPAYDKVGAVSIGTPADNAQIYVLDKNNNPMPIGAAGEICIGGDGVARGYLNRPELTAEKFVDNPFIAGGKMYRSGDLARVRPDGRLDLIGRIDNQVKIRGYRIELGEIESALSQHQDITHCVVEARKHDDDFALASAVEYCAKCGLPANYPGAVFDAEGVCDMCRLFDTYQSEAMKYFKTIDDLKAVFAKEKSSGDYDCLALFSGGKDSTYMLYRLVEMGLKVLAFTFDNGYLYEGAKANIKRIVHELKIDHVFGSSRNIDEILADSLRRYSNVCNECFKMVYTQGVKLAKEKGVKYIVTGLSRGQLFETRLGELFRGQVFNEADIDRTVLEARKLYHRMDDAVSRYEDVTLLKDGAVFDDIQFVDYYRYSDVTREDIYAYLEKNVAWVNPAETAGCTTNCLVNDVGIYAHTKERGYNNYALPNSWEVRLGHKKRETSIEELTSPLDMPTVRSILKKIGYAEKWNEDGRAASYLVGYYVSGDGLEPAHVKEFLSRTLPDYMIPSDFIRLEKMPLNANGKVDRRALPAPGGTRAKPDRIYVAPRTPTEEKMAEIWRQLLGVGQIGVYDNFFDLGGHSLLATQVVARARQAFGVELPLISIFENPTVVNLSALVISEQLKSAGVDSLEDIMAEVDGMSDEEVAKGLQD